MPQSVPQVLLSVMVVPATAETVSRTATVADMLAPATYATHPVQQTVTATPQTATGVQTETIPATTSVPITISALGGRCVMAAIASREIARVIVIAPLPAVVTPARTTRATPHARIIRTAIPQAVTGAGKTPIATTSAMPTTIAN